MIALVPWPSRLVVAVLLLALPTLLVLAVLTVLAELPVVAALVAALAVMGGLLVLLRPLFAGLDQLRVALEALSEDEAAAPRLHSHSPTAHALWSALARMARAQRQRAQARAAALDAAEAVLAALADPLIVIDDRREVVSANAAAARLFGERLAGRDLAVALRNPAVLAAADAVLRGAPGRLVEVELGGAVERHLSARIAPLQRGTVAGAAALVTLHDLTTLKRSERMRADFIANASHELRTPLATLIGFIETLRGPARDDREAQTRFLAIMGEQAARMARLVDDLLSLSRIELNEHQPPSARVDLRLVLGATADMLEQRAAARDMQVKLALPEDLPPVVGDADELAQVFQNLIDNAIKYGRRGTAIEVSAGPAARPLAGSRPGERLPAVTVAVRDHGAGIPRDHLPRLTERFYRVDAARSRELGGTGLGLAIVKHVVNRHRGVLEIDSELGRGSVFSVHLPIAVAAGSSPGEASRPETEGKAVARGGVEADDEAASKPRLM